MLRFKHQTSARHLNSKNVPTLVFAGPLKRGIIDTLAMAIFRAGGSQENTSLAAGGTAANKTLGAFTPTSCPNCSRERTLQIHLILSCHRGWK